MDKKNKLLLGLLTFVVVCVIGYALFSETITVTGTATAKGSFEIVGSCQTGVTSNFINGMKLNYGIDYKEGGYKNDYCSFNGNQATISVELEYPTAERWFTIKLTNNGTIPAVLGEPVLKKNELCVDNVCENLFESTAEQQRIVSLFTTTNNYILGVQIGNGDIITLDVVTDDIMKEFTNEKEEQVLKPGNSVYLGVRARFHNNLGYNRPGELEYSNKVVYEYPFIQVAND